MGSHTSPQLSIAIGLLAAAGCACMGCKSDESASSGPIMTGAGRELTPELFQQLMEQGTLLPTDAMDDSSAAIDPATGAPHAESEEGAGSDDGSVAPFVEEPINPYLEFGSRIVVYEDSGLIMKPFPVRSGQGEGLQSLLTDYGNFLIFDPETMGPEQTATSVLLDLRKDFDTELLSADLRGEDPPTQSTQINISDWLIVKASADNLREVEYFIDLFAAGPPQIEIEAKIVEWVTRDSFDWGVQPRVGADGNPIPMVTFPSHTAVSDLIWNFPSGAGSTGFGAGVTAIQDGTIYAAMFELLATFENVSIISRPKVAVRDGARAQIQAVELIPYLEVQSISNVGIQNTKIAYQEVGIRLFVTPRLIGTNTVSLEIDIEASQQTGSVAPTQIFGNTQDPNSINSVITVPILSNRSAKTIVYLKPGQAVIIGGLISERTVDEESKVPFLGDIPLLGYLFKSISKSKQKAQVLFFLRPRVLEGTDLNRSF